MSKHILCILSDIYIYSPFHKIDFEKAQTNKTILYNEETLTATKLKVTFLQYNLIFNFYGKRTRFPNLFPDNN